MAADDGSTLRVVVTAQNTAGSASAPSAVTAVVRTAPTVTTSPSIPSKPQEAQTLTVTAGTYGGTSPITSFMPGLARSSTEWIPPGFDFGTIRTSVFVTNLIGFSTRPCW